MGAEILDCPSCHAVGCLVWREQWRSVLTHHTTWAYDCHACCVQVTFELSDVDLIGGVHIDPATMLFEHEQTGQVSRGKLSIHHPAPVFGAFARGGIVPVAARNNTAIGYSALAAPPGGFVALGQPDVVDPEPAEPGPELKALAGSVIGYRAWKIKDWALYGTGGFGGAWAPGVNEATCALTGARHAAPAEGCQCGMYALARFDDQTSWWRDADVLGAVEAWADESDGNHDRFFVHSTGFRAQYAKIILLAVSDDYPRAKNGAIRALASEHEADVCKREHLEDAAKEHGQLVPDELLAWAKEGESEHDDGQYLGGAVLALSHTMQISSAQAAAIGRQFLSAFSSQPATPSPLKRPAHPKGVKKTLKTNGPPSLGKWQINDRVLDRRGDLWRCVKAGKPGTWEPLQ